MSGVFTGIVEATGVVNLVNTNAAGCRIRFRAPDVIEGLTVGRSVAVDGACLTAVELHPDGFSVDVIGTTLERTVATIGGLLLFYATTITDIAGAALFVIAIGLHLARPVKSIRRVLADDT